MQTYEDKDDNNIINNEILKCKDTFSRCLDLSGRNVTFLDNTLFDLVHLQCLYLSKNCISILPDAFFKLLPVLKWLDLRDNKLEVFPTKIDSEHPLENLLLENNKLLILPAEIGLFLKLRSLNIKNNPIENLSSEIILKGTKCILNYLRNLLIEHGKLTLNWDKEEDNKANKNLNNNLKKKNSSSKLVKSKIVNKTQSEKYIDDIYGAPITDSKLEMAIITEKRLSKIKSEKIKQDKIIQNMKNNELSLDWKNEYKKLQAKKELEKRLYGLDYEDPVACAPFAVKKEDFRLPTNDERLQARLTNEEIVKPESMSFEERQQIEIARFHHENFLKEKTTELLMRLKIKEENENKNTSEALAIAEENLYYAKKLQEEIQKCRRVLEFGLDPYPV